MKKLVLILTATLLTSSAFAFDDGGSPFVKQIPEVSAMLGKYSADVLIAKINLIVSFVEYRSYHQALSVSDVWSDILRTSKLSDAWKATLASRVSSLQDIRNNLLICEGTVEAVTNEVLSETRIK